MKNNPLVSIITATLNSKDTIEETICSVLNQNYKNLEYIVIDGGSTDGTLEIVKKYEPRISKLVSEPDRGKYDAMNKGIELSSGEIVGILNSDDFYVDGNVISIVAENMEEKKADCCWGDLFYVDRNFPERVIRYWKSSEYREGKFKEGWMPPHPTFFVKKEIYKKHGLYLIDFNFAGDYEMMLRLLEKYRIRSCYIHKILVKMRVGGEGNKNILNRIKANFVAYKAWEENGMKINPLVIFFWKPFSKISQFFKKYE